MLDRAGRSRDPAAYRPHLDHSAGVFIMLLSRRACAAPRRFATRLHFIADGGKATWGNAFPADDDAAAAWAAATMAAGLDVESEVASVALARAVFSGRLGVAAVLLEAGVDPCAVVEMRPQLERGAGAL